jgi:uncharacterized C2H2 Zn-finger protein
VEERAEPRRRRGRTLTACPRCGGLGYLKRRAVGDHVYYYVYHVSRAGGRRHERACYIGAETYDYVERFNDLGLAGGADEERFRRYAEQLVSRLRPDELSWLMDLMRRRLSGAGSAQPGFTQS